MQGQGACSCHSGGRRGRAAEGDKTMLTVRGLSLVLVSIAFELVPSSGSLLPTFVVYEKQCSQSLRSAHGPMRLRGGGGGSKGGDRPSKKLLRGHIRQRFHACQRRIDPRCNFLPTCMTGSCESLLVCHARRRAWAAWEGRRWRHCAQQAASLLACLCRSGRQPRCLETRARKDES